MIRIAGLLPSDVVLLKRNSLVRACSRVFPRLLYLFKHKEIFPSVGYSLGSFKNRVFSAFRPSSVVSFSWPVVPVFRLVSSDEHGERVWFGAYNLLIIIALILKL